MHNNMNATIKKVPVEFRWPVIQTGECEVEVQIPLTQGDLVHLNLAAISELNLSDKEIVAATNAAFDAIINEIIIVK